MVYLDYNIFVKAVKDLSFKKTLMALVATKKYIFPFTHVHIAEVNRITGANTKQDQNARLTAIKDISHSSYLDYREHINSYTIRSRDPFEVFKTINDVPKEYIDEVSKLATDQYVRKEFPDLPENCFRLEDQYGYFTKLFRTQFPDLSKKINNMSKERAIKYLEEEIFGMDFVHFFDLFLNSQKGLNNNLKKMGLEFFIDNTLYLAGYNTPTKDIKKPAGLISDHQHLSFAHNCPIIISDDENFRKKTKDVNESPPVFVGDSTKGINFLLVHCGLINLVSKESGQCINKEFLEACLQEFQKSKS